MRVAICGLLPVQNRELEKRFGHRADLRFIENDVPPPRWQAQTEGVDKVVVSTKFSSHALTNAIERSKYVPVNGALSAIARTLDELLPQTHRETLTTLRDAAKDDDKAPTETEAATVAKKNGKFSGATAKAYKLLAQLTPGQVIDGKFLGERIGVDRDAGISYTILKNLAGYGYLRNPKKGKYIITDDTKKIADYEHGPGKRIPRLVNGTEAPAPLAAKVTELIADPKSPVAQLQRYVTSLRMLAANIEALLPKLVLGGTTRKVDLSHVPMPKLLEEIGNRQLEKRTRPRANS